jgi:hypothetical protein
MPKGPSPKGEYVGKSSVFSTRIRPDLRKRLEQAAKLSGRSLSQEVEHRLRRSFIEDDKIADAFGDRRTYRLMRMMADAIHMSNDKEDPEAWLKDPVTFVKAIASATDILESIRPGHVTGKQYADVMMRRSAGASLWRDIQIANVSLPLNEGTRSDHQHAISRSDIGEEILRRTLPENRKKLIDEWMKAIVDELKGRAKK